MMGPRTSEEVEAFARGTLDRSLTRPPVPDIPVDQLMRAVEGVRAYVGSHLSRYGLFQDLDDVLQDIRVAAWEGTVRGSYQAIPDVKFDAWVQGIACNLCADHLRRSIAKSTVPFVDYPERGVHEVADLGLTRRSDPVSEEATGGVWAANILRIVKEHVSDGIWDLAVENVLRPSRYGDPDNAGVADSKHWHALTVVRQMAVAVKNAMDVDPRTVEDLPSLREASLESLPTPLLRLIAKRVVVPGFKGKERAAAAAGVAQESGVSARYVEVQIGLVRDMIQAVEEVLRSGTGIEGTVTHSRAKRPHATVAKGLDRPVTSRSHVPEIAAS
ncbi:hypothetical protein QO003_003068 [Arthrobacter silviterrae]|uniref:RNA polymerase sigma-70 region 2 domain-containing protein n=1 Tax=Arthrobacter silviterrae TaxID=2026658 RepID=A0ABX0DAK9_9MICC|nr:sigma factor [Arthrobacter silviterrae]MDQ0278765.1 hypothetical protein [Arthrobacter silviterrae]NGN83939.1 hypothetical protein [Arthrobacter silviterrae]